MGPIVRCAVLNRLPNNNGVNSSLLEWIDGSVRNDLGMQSSDNHDDLRDSPRKPVNRWREHGDNFNRPMSLVHRYHWIHLPAEIPRRRRVVHHMAIHDENPITHKHTPSLVYSIVDGTAARHTTTHARRVLHVVHNDALPIGARTSTRATIH